MRALFLLMLLCPLLVFPSNEVVPEGYKLIWLVLAILALALVIPAFRKLTGKRQVSFRLPSFGRPLKVDLLQDRRYRPKMLTLVVKNTSRKDLDIEAPVILFRRLRSIRKFKLKGIDRHEIYPLYLEAGKMHELRINLGIFHGYDRTLRSYYRARIFIRDTGGRKYSSRYVTLRKSLFS